ncbi:EamA family transporter RarD [Pseudomonas sp. BN102]|uniref:EamA family transporter RarD n=1 Tax=Pseudomonas sp. BN102 TaxID=2567886 RepID=UPI002458EEA8|nr:EamA family transporter RarD [Pseudomonas sp. BN102]MDH4608818.1 EamA family transporter RarD [Pseudomonas sp. BN102]
MNKGVALSVVSSCMFASLYYYATLLVPLTGLEIFGWRMLLTLPCVTLFMLIGGEWKRVLEIGERLRKRPILILALCMSSGLLGIQLWLFLWAPLNGRGLQVSLGYFLLPLAMLLVGRLLYRERLTQLQKMAALSATLGVAHELYQVGGFSWEALLVAIGLPIYFILRRKLRTDHLGGLWFDMLLTLPFATWIILGQGAGVEHFAQSPRLLILIVILAVISATAFMSYIVASRILSFGIFGLLGYVEPVLMVGVALIIGEQIQPEEWLTYIPIWIAVGLLVLEGVRHLGREARKTPSATRPTDLWTSVCLDQGMSRQLHEAQPCSCQK